MLARLEVDVPSQGGRKERRLLMAPLDISPATIMLILVIAALAALAVRRLARRGTCDCHDHCGDKPAGGGCAGCSGCGAVDTMVADMERAAKQASARS